jgi:hypothetical protein
MNAHDFINITIKLQHTKSATCFRPYWHIVRGHKIVQNDENVLGAAQLPAAHIFSYITLPQTQPHREQGNKDQKSSVHTAGIY